MQPVLQQKQNYGSSATSKVQKQNYGSSATSKVRMVDSYSILRVHFPVYTPFIEVIFPFL